MRKHHVQRGAASLMQGGGDVILPCSEGVRLHGVYNPQADASAARGLIILIHGWEGCAQSTYLLPAANRLYCEGYSVFRLHLRDHGDSHHLNDAPFLATRSQEVKDAVAAIVAQYPHEYVGLAGFSLGANIALRVGAENPVLDQVVAIAPPIAPQTAAEAIAESVIYTRYFVRKWHRSMEKKMALFPAHRVNRDLLKIKRLIPLHDAFIPRYSHFDSAEAYFKAYALDVQGLPTMTTPCHVILAADDPVIPIASKALLPNHENLTVEVTRYGGHCGFLMDWALNSWIDGRLTQLFK